MNAQEVLTNIDKMLADAEEYTKEYSTEWRKARKKWRIREVYNDLGIFDWWDEYLSVSQLKSMKTFIQQGMKRGFCGYVCFKVGVKHCAHGMWISKKESTDGYSPDGACLYHSFRSCDNYWDMELDNGKWMHELYPDKEDFTLKEIDEQLALEKATSRVLSFGIDIAVDKNDTELDGYTVAVLLKYVKNLMFGNDEKKIDVLGCEFKADVTGEYIKDGWIL